MRTDSKHSSDLNEPVALFELNTKSGTVNSRQLATINKVKFEMSKDEIATLLEKLENIQKSMDDLSH